MYIYLADKQNILNNVFCIKNLGSQAVGSRQC